MKYMLTLRIVKLKASVDPLRLNGELKKLDYGRNRFKVYNLLCPKSID